MQHHLHHRELVEIGVEQAVDDHDDAARWCPVSACVRLSRAASACAYGPFPGRPTAFCGPASQSPYYAGHKQWVSDKTVILKEIGR
jgi:hypothetical protein